MTPAEVLSKARDVLAERGWHQGDYEGPTGAVCTFGALNLAAGERQAAHISAEATNASFYLCSVVPECIAGVGPWNDDPTTTYEDVVLALKRAEELASA